MDHIKKILLVSAGFLFVALGIIGTFLPIMPAIPFLILASICFSKSSKKFHDLLLNNKLVGPYLKKYHENNGITLKAKVLFITVQWCGVLATALFLIHNLLSRVLLVAIALGVTWYILSLKTAKKPLS